MDTATKIPFSTLSDTDRQVLRTHYVQLARRTCPCLDSSCSDLEFVRELYRRLMRIVDIATGLVCRRWEDNITDLQAIRDYLCNEAAKTREAAQPDTAGSGNTAINRETAFPGNGISDTYTALAEEAAEAARLRNMLRRTDEWLGLCTHLMHEQLPLHSIINDATGQMEDIELLFGPAGEK